jgi:hypothetical protein
VRINGGEEQPRVLLLSVPYALKAADAQTLGGLPASAFLLAGAANAAAIQSNVATSPSPTSPATSSDVTTSGGTVNSFRCSPIASFTWLNRSTNGCSLEWHDWEVLAAIAKASLNHGRDCRLTKKLWDTASMKYEEALRLSLKMRREDLHITKRRARKLGDLRPFHPAQQVCSATVSLTA